MPEQEQQAWQSSGWQSWQNPQQSYGQQPPATRTSNQSANASGQQPSGQYRQAGQQYAQGQYRQYGQQYGQGQYAQGQYGQAGQYGQYGQYRQAGQTGQTPRQQMAAQQQRQAQQAANARNAAPNAQGQGQVQGQAQGVDPNGRRSVDGRRPTYRYPNGSMGAGNGLYESATSSTPTWRDSLRDYSTGIIVVLVIIVLIVVIVASIVHSSSEEEDEAVAPVESTESTETEDDADADDDATADATGYGLSTSLLDLISSGATLSTFSLSSASAPTLTDSETSAITSAISAIEALADVGFVFYDVDTGLGISYNVDATVYGAGSFKAPYALYVCEDLIEGGVISLADVSSLLEESLSDSGASAYLELRDTYDSVDYDNWATSLGATDVLYTSDSHYPWYCARSAAKLWTEIYLYLQTGTETAQWLEDELSEVTTSFIRVGVNDEDATVMSRSGAYAGSTSTYDSLCDAGLVVIDGHTYVLCVMSYMADSDSNRELLQDLVAAIYAARDELSSDDTVTAAATTTEDETEADETESESESESESDEAETDEDATE